MCGIFGSIGSNISHEKARKLCNLLKHRGPDDGNVWMDEKNKVFIGQRRLSIIDLSSKAKQPMKSKCGNYIISYNGEIYNYLELRHELTKLGYMFSSNSDTEVILAGCLIWGIEKTLKKLEGMFAFAFYDRKKNYLWLARDPMGIKPLYFSKMGDKFVFASELNPILSFNFVDKSLNKDSLFSYFRYGYVPSPFSIFKNIKKLQAGNFLLFEKGKIQIQNFWDHEEISKEKYRVNPNALSLNQYTNLIENELLKSVKFHMQSDVPYGAFLSGGIDSSTIVALMQSQSLKPVNTFSIGFKEKAHDESKYARAVAKHLGTNHNEIIISSSDAIPILMESSKYFDEPFADNSAIPTYLVSKFARNYVKVCLSGDGGDELYGGYPRYFWAKRIENIRKLSPSFSKLLGNFLSSIPSSVLNKYIDPILGYRFSGAEGLSHRVDRLANYLKVCRKFVYQELTPYWSDPLNLLNMENYNEMGNDDISFENLSWSEEMMLIDQKYYLQDNILTKLDRTSMAVSLEARVPFLTHKMVELSWKVPTSMKFENNSDRGKLLLRKLLEKYIPKNLIDRPKQGFGLPLNTWLRGPLRDWVESIFNKNTIEESGLNNSLVSEIWKQQLDGENRQEKIWSIIMYMQWYNRVTSS